MGSCQTYSTRPKFPPVRQALSSIRKLLKMLPLHQWAYLARLLTILACRIHSWIKLLLGFLSKQPVKHCPTPWKLANRKKLQGQHQLYFAMSWDQSVWCLQQQSLTVKFWGSNREQWPEPALLIALVDHHKHSPFLWVSACAYHSLSLECSSSPVDRKSYPNPAHKT